MAKNKIRAVIGEENEVGNNRKEIYQLAIEKYKKALDEGFYLEAVAICESLITDRLESRNGTLTEVNVQFETIGRLIKSLKENEKDNEMLALYEDISSWGLKRNKAIHESVKISKEKPKKWQEFQDEAKQTAEEGFELFRTLDKRVKKLSSKK